MTVVIVSDGKNDYLRGLTRQAISSCGCDCVVVERQGLSWDGAITVHYDGEFNYNRCLNLGYKYTTGNVCFCNNDLLFHDWLGIEQHLGEYGSLSPISKGWFKHEGLSGVVEGYEIGKHLCGWCLVVSRETMEITGGFDEGVDFYFSDNIWADQLRYHGIKHALCCDYRVDHLTSKTLLSVRGDKREFYEQGQLNKYHEARKRYIG